MARARPHRLAVRTSGFHPENRGFDPRWGHKKPIILHNSGPCAILRAAFNRKQEDDVNLNLLSRMLTLLVVALVVATGLRPTRRMLALEVLVNSAVVAINAVLLDRGVEGASVLLMGSIATLCLLLWTVANGRVIRATE